MWGLVAGTLHVVPYAGLLVAVGLTAVEVYAVQASPAAASLAAALVAGIGIVIGSGVATWLQGRAASVDGAVMFGGTVATSVLWGGWGLLLGPVLVLAARVVWRHAALQSTTSGSRASMRVPAPGVDDTLSMPPTASTR
jgi:predicted PurR-regulated permease PerM